MSSRRLPAVLSVAVGLVALGCTSSSTGLPGREVPTPTTLPPGVISAEQACRRVVDGPFASALHSVEQVHLVLTTYGKGVPVESQGDMSTGMPPDTLVWVVDVHAKKVDVIFSSPLGGSPPILPGTEYSVVMNARTGVGTDSGTGDSWPLPLSTVGTLVSLPPTC